MSAMKSFRWLSCICLLVAFFAWPSGAAAQTCYTPATPPACPTSLTGLAQRRCESLRYFDAELVPHPTAGTSNGLPSRQVLNPYQECNGSTPNPITKANGSEDLYYEKALSILALADMTGSNSRLAEANEVLRFALFDANGWPAATIDRINYDANGGGDTMPWNLYSRSLASRVYWLYSEALAPDIKAEYEKRFGWMRCTGPQTGGSENQQNIWNTSMLLAHDSGLAPLSCTTTQAASNASSVASTVSTAMTAFAVNGSKEAGNPFYNGWSVVSFANLADLLKPSGSYVTYANRARTLVDYFLTQQAVFSRGNWWASPAVRRVQDTNGPLNFSEEPSYWAQVFFTSPASALTTLLELVASNYSPLVAHQEQFADAQHFTARASQGPWNHHAYHGNTFSMGVQNTLDSSRYRGQNGGVGTHDVAPVLVRGNSRLQLLHASSYDWNVGPSKSIGKYEMSFGSGTAAIAHLGGDVVGTQGASGSYTADPHVFYDNRRWTYTSVAGNNCWGFLSNTSVYVAVSMSQGNTVNQLVTGAIYHLTTSLTTPPNRGVTAYMEVGRPSDFGNSVATFANAVVSRAGNTCPQANATTGVVSYRNADNAVMTFTPTYAADSATATVAVSSGPDAGNWTQTVLDSLGRFSMDAGTYELNDFTLTSPTGKVITFNHTNGTLSGTSAALQRLTPGFTFGNLNVPPPTPVQVVVDVDATVAGYLTATGGASATYSPTTALTTSVSSTDNKWHVSNDYIGLAGLNTFTTHGATESSPTLTVTVSGLVPNTAYDLYGRFATASLQTAPAYWGPEMGPTSALVVRYSQAHTDFNMIQDWGNWEEREVDLGRVTTTGSGTTTLVLDDETVNNNAVWSGLRLQPVGTTPAPLVKVIALTEDAHTLEAVPGANYGTLDYLRIATGTGQQAYSWLKLPVSGFSGKVIRARLKMRPKVTIDSAYVYRICNNTWTESTVTWSNQPTASNCGYQTERLAMTANSTQFFDLTDFINALTTYSIGIVTDDPDPALDFYSSEYVTTTYRPELQIEYRP